MVKVKISEVLSEYSSNISFQFIVLILCVGLALYVLRSFLGGSSGRNTIAIIGLSGSGKTQLFSQLCYGVDVLTVTSMKETSGYYTSTNSKNMLLYDIPGHERIRYTLLDKMKKQIQAIVYLLDASTLQENLQDVAEYLYRIFCDGTLRRSHPHILIACNKQDLPSAKGCGLIKSSLEKEINLLRVTKGNQLKSVGSDGNPDSYLGYPEQDFEFTHLKPINVSFTESIATKGEDIEGITKWLESIM